MKNKTFPLLIVLSLTTFLSCSQNKKTTVNSDAEVTNPKKETVKNVPHNYGGWYCPDNLNGFPAVDISNWKNVPVVNGRMATKEEAQNGTSLIFVDAEKYPNAKPLDMVMPKLASFYNQNSKRDDLVIVIQAININNDSIVGFRYLNGGNGSARLNEVRMLSDSEIEKIPSMRFVTFTVNIKATPNAIWEILTKPEKTQSLQSTFDKDNTLKKDWKKTSNVNYYYPKAGMLTSSYADELFGNYYIQNDYSNFQYNQKFLIMENAKTMFTELKIVCGPYGTDYETQKKSLIDWSNKVKELSEKEK